MADKKVETPDAPTAHGVNAEFPNETAEQYAKRIQGRQPKGKSANAEPGVSVIDEVKEPTDGK